MYKVLEMHAPCTRNARTMHSKCTHHVLVHAYTYVHTHTHAHARTMYSYVPSGVSGGFCAAIHATISGVLVQHLRTQTVTIAGDGIRVNKRNGLVNGASKI